MLYYRKNGKTDCKEINFRLKNVATTNIYTKSQNNLYIPTN